MLTNYLKIAFRNLHKNKFFSLINLLGLSIGIASTILVFLFVRDEFRTDRFHRNADRLYQVVMQEKNQGSGEIDVMEPQPYPLGPSLQEDLPEVLNFVRFYQREYYIKTSAQAAKQLILFADSSLLQVFDFPLSRGNPNLALADAYSAAISETKARQLFGELDPIGRTIAIRLNDEYEDFQVTAVFEDIPAYSSIGAEMILPLHGPVVPKVIPALASENFSPWHVNSFKTFVLLHPSATPEVLQEKLASLRSTYNPTEADYLAERKKEVGEDLRRGYQLIPLPEVYFRSQYLVDSRRSSSKPVYSYILGTIAVGILLMACFNYLTLSIGRASKRTREIGLRKVVGARRWQITFQFGSEALLISLLSLGLAFLLVGLLLPTFNQLSGKALSLSVLSEPLAIGVIIGITLTTGLLAGVYPALYLSSIPTLDAFMKKFTLGRVNLFTKVLVTFQFCLPVIFLVFTVVMIRQLQFMRTQDLGFTQERVLVIENNAADQTQAWERFRDRVETRHEVVSIAVASNALAQGTSTFYFSRDRERLSQVPVSVYDVSATFLETLELSLLKGRWFDPQLASDSTDAIVVNEEFVRTFGWAEPIGKEIEGDRVIGVVNDFHTKSLAHAIPPVALYLARDSRSQGHILVKVASSDLSRTIAELSEVWQGSITDTPFTYSFLDDDFQALYEQEERWRQIIQWVSAITVLIAVLGLLGLTVLAAAGREKEIGIRKVLGASVTSLLLLLSRDFLKLVLIALLIAIPIANYGVMEWLADFAYRVEIQWWLFAIPAGLILLIALLSISHQTFRAATKNPADSLRHE